MALSTASAKAAQTALTAREGSIFRCLTAVKEDLLGIAAQFSAYIDYPDEDIPDLDTTAWRDTEAVVEQVFARFCVGK